MNLKQTAILVLGLMPFALGAQPSQPQVSSPPNTQVQIAPSTTHSSAVMVPGQTSSEMPERKKLSYAIGMYFARDITNKLNHGQIDLDTNIVIEAISTVVSGKPPAMTEKEVQDIFNQLRSAMRAKMQAKEQEAKAKNQAFLSDFSKSSGVKVMPDGLEYKIIQQGTGPKPQNNDKVTVSYVGTLADGTQFDRNESFTTAIHGGIIKGWQEILPLMNVGSKYRIVIPPELGYGPRGYPPKIPANAILVFDMEVKALQPEQNGPGGKVMPGGAAASPSTPVVSGEIIKVPSADELKKGAKIEVIKAGQTNAAPTTPSN